MQFGGNSSSTGQQKTMQTPENSKPNKNKKEPEETNRLLAVRSVSAPLTHFYDENGQEVKTVRLCQILLKIHTHKLCTWVFNGMQCNAMDAMECNGHVYTRKC